MAFILRANGRYVEMVINGCNDPNCTEENGCGQIELFCSPYDQKNVSPLVILFLHNIFGRQDMLEGILRKYEQFYEKQENKGKNGIDTMKDIIIEDCNIDESWKICPKCYEEYKNNKAVFENVSYTIPDLKGCDYHF